jgi:hypothetical protein
MIASGTVLPPIPAVLTSAAEVLRVNGLHKTAYWPHKFPLLNVPPWKPGTPCCVIGAIAVALDPDDPDNGLSLTDPYSLHLGQYIAASGIRPDCLVTLWNDAPERTKEEVIEVLLAAAKWEMPKCGAVLTDGIACQLEPGHWGSCMWRPEGDDNGSGDA